MHALNIINSTTECTKRQNMTHMLYHKAYMAKRFKLATKAIHRGGNAKKRTFDWVIAPLKDGCVFVE